MCRRWGGQRLQDVGEAGELDDLDGAPRPPRRPQPEEVRLHEPEDAGGQRGAQNRPEAGRGHGEWAPEKLLRPGGLRQHTHRAPASRRHSLQVNRV